MYCTYHPDRPAVNTCSRCGEPVCAGCNYITGRSPICRKCWEKIEAAPTSAMPLPYELAGIPLPAQVKSRALGKGKTIFFIILGLIVLSVGGWFTYQSFFPSGNLWPVSVNTGSPAHAYMQILSS